MAHLTDFSFEFFYEILTEDASLLFLYHGAKKSKMTKNSNQGGPAHALIAHYWTRKKIISRYCKATKTVGMCNNIFHRLHKCHALWKVVIAKLVSLIFLWLHFLQEISKPSARYTELLLVRLIGKMLSAVYSTVNCCCFCCCCCCCCCC